MAEVESHFDRDGPEPSLRTSLPRLLEQDDHRKVWRENQWAGFGEAKLHRAQNKRKLLRQLRDGLVLVSKRGIWLGEGKLLVLLESAHLPFPFHLYHKV